MTYLVWAISVVWAIDVGWKMSARMKHKRYQKNDRMEERRGEGTLEEGRFRKVQQFGGGKDMTGGLE